MANDIESKIDELSQGSVFTGERINVAMKTGGKGGLGKIFERAGEKLQVIEKAKEEAVVDVVKDSKVPAIRSLKSRAKEKQIIPQEKKNERKTKVLLQEENTTIDDIAKQQEEINNSFTPVEETPSTVLNSDSPVADYELDSSSSLAKKMADEPEITGEQLGAGLVKAEEEISSIKAKRIPDEQLAGLPEAEVKRIRAQERAELLPPEQVFNLARNGDLAPALKSISELAGIETKTINRKELAAKALEKGFDEKFINKLVDGELGVGPEVAAQVLAAEDWAATVLDDLGTKILSGAATDLEKLNATKAIAFHSLVLRSVKGYKTNLAQSLGMLGVDLNDFLKNVDFGLDGLRSQEDLNAFFVKFKAIKDNPEAQRKLIDAAATGNVADAGVAAVLGGMVSGTKTLLNIALGDAPRILLRPAETFTAATAGAIRTIGQYSDSPLLNKLQLGSKNTHFFNEALAQIISLEKGIFTGIKAASYAWKEGVSTIDKSLGRLDVRARPDMFDVNPEWSTMAQLAVGAYNFAHSYGPRSVLTISEFMKGIHYQMGVDALATRRGIEAYDLAFSITKDESKAWAAFDEAAEMIRMDPPQDVVMEAKKWTLESKPEPGSSAETLTRAINSKNNLGRFLKLTVPFATTRINDMVQALERTPIGLLKDFGVQVVKEGTQILNFNSINSFSERMKDLGKRFSEDINSGDFMKRDMALAKAGVGFGIISYYVSEAASGKLTGAGPRNKTDRDNWLAQGALPFAEIRNLEELEGATTEQKFALLKAQYGESYKYSVGTGEFAGKIFIPHMGLSTNSAFKAIAALYAENSSEIGVVEGDEDDMTNLAAYAGMALYEFSLNAPGIQEVGEIGMKIPRLSKESETNFAGSAIRGGVKMFGDVAVPFPSALRREFVRAFDRTKYEYQADPDQDPLVAEMVNGFNEFAYGLGLKKGNVKKNIFNEPQERDFIYSSNSVGKDSEAIQILTISNVSSRLPQRKFVQTEDVLVGNTNRKVEITVPYNDKEYEELLRLANDKEYLGGFNLKQKILDLKNDGNWINANPDMKKSHVQSLKDSAFQYAKDVLYNPSLIRIDSPSVQKNLEAVSKTLNERISKEKHKATLNLIQF
jgi:hypothetical protein